MRQWFYKQNSLRPVNAWNKLLKLSFIKENGLYNKEGQLWEDQLWAFYLKRHLNHAMLVSSVTYICYRHSGSIVTGTNKEEMLRQMGYIYREISCSIKSGEHIEEIVCWLQDFCRFYVEASDNEDYQFAFSVFLRQLSDGKHKREEQRLKRVHLMAKSPMGRIIYRGAARAKFILKRLGWLNCIIGGSE